MIRTKMLQDNHGFRQAVVCNPYTVIGPPPAYKVFIGCFAADSHHVYSFGLIWAKCSVSLNDDTAIGSLVF